MLWNHSYVLWPRLAYPETDLFGFFSAGTMFPLQQFNQNSVFQPISAKFQQAERGLVGWEAGRVSSKHWHVDAIGSLDGTSDEAKLPRYPQ